MDDALARGHQIDRARLDRREGAERIAMVDRAGEQIGDGGEVDVRVRPDVDPAARRSFAGPIWSKKMNGPTVVRSRCGRVRWTLNPPRSWVVGKQRLEDEIVGRCVGASAARRRWSISAATNR
jgi:hypothetical protein